MKLEFPVKNEKLTVSALYNGIRIYAENPVKIRCLDGLEKRCKYDVIEEDGNKIRAICNVGSEKGSFTVTDTYQKVSKGIFIERKIVCTEAKESIPVRFTTEWYVKDKSAKSFEDYSFIIPGALYNKNDTDEDGIDDYLGTFCQDYKDDRNPSLSIMEYCENSHYFVSLIRADLPKWDFTITQEQIRNRQFIHDTDIGSLGISISDRNSSELILRCDYPFCERNSFCLNVDGSGWGAYKSMQKGDELEVSYLLYIDTADNLTEGSWKVTKLQMDRIMNPDIELPFTLDEARACRRKMTFDSFREFPDKKGKPAGFFVHFSPRKSYGKQNILEYGFCGQQTMISYVMLGEAEDLDDDEYRRRAVCTLDFFADYCIEKSGLPNAMYNVDKEEFVYWWTGILYPFQYSEDRNTLEGYLGNQLVSSLMPIAAELRKIKGNYCRTMIDSMYYLFLSYLKEKEKGIEHRNWYKAVEHFCTRMLKLQNANGSWNRGYTMDGKPLRSPREWFGATEKEMCSGVIFPAQLLVRMYEYTGKEEYLKAAERAAYYVERTYVKDITYIGGLNDTSHIKSVKIDAVGVMFAMRTMLMVYEKNKDPRLLLGARDAARVLGSWTYLWDIPFDEETTLGKYGFKTTGWTGCDVIPACSYVDDEFVEFIPELLRVAEYCKDKDLAILAQIVTRGMQHGLSMPQNMYGYSMPGVQCEGYMTSLWLADTEYTEFSGASAKNKGDDNDTCNGLVNAQAILNLKYIKDRFDTYDFNKIIKQILD